MTTYHVALFVHIMSAITLFGAFVLLQLGGGRLRSATSVGQARLWLDVLRPAQGTVLGAAVLLVLSGMFIIATELQTMPPWAEIALPGLAVIAAASTFVHRRSFRAMTAALAGPPNGPLSPELAHLLAAPTPWVIAAAMNGAATGIVLTMAAKPDRLVSLLIVLAFGGIGVIIGLLRTRSRGAASSAAVQTGRGAV